MATPMTPSQHYAEAERLIEVHAENGRRNREHPLDEIRLAHDANLLAKAQVHATLATVSLEVARP